MTLRIDIQYEIKQYQFAAYQNKYLILCKHLIIKMECKFVWDEQKRPKRNYKDYQYTTTYPTNRILKQKFQSSEQISAFLLKNAQEIGYCKWQLFEKTVIDEGDYMRIIYSCRSRLCDAELIYHQKKIDMVADQDGQYPRKYYLARVKVNNFHSHPLKLTRKLANQQNIRQYLFDLPVEQKFQNHVQVVKQRFKLSRCQARYLKDRVFWRFKSQDHMLSKLTERKVTFRRKLQDGKSSILLLVSETMKKNYQKYGDILCFDITYKLLMRKKEQLKHTGIGFFIGQDQNSRIILFGVAVIQHETADHFYILFEYFFEMVAYVPQTILTDDQRAIGNALQRIKKAKNYQYVHLLDWYHKMTAVKRFTKREPYREQLFTLFNRMLKQPSKMVYRDIIFEIAGMLEKEEVMRDFLRDQMQCCLSQVPEKFFAFGISSTRAQAFNRLIKRSVPIQTNLGRLIFFVLRVEKRLMNRMAVLNYMNQQLLVNIYDKQIMMLHDKLEHLAFQQIRQYHFESKEFYKVESTQNPLIKRIPYIKYERKYYFNLMYDIKYDCWRCECKNNFRTGMPCSHLFRIIRQYGGCIAYYINQRWYHDKDAAQVKKPSRPSIKDKRI